MTFTKPQWITDFLNVLSPDDWVMLRSCGISFSPTLLKRPLDWTLLNAAMSFWNPKTWTFFFPRGEMMILQEEVAPLMGIRQIAQEEEERLGRMARLGIFEEQRFSWPLADILFANSFTGDELNLNKLWEEYKLQIVNRKMEDGFETRRIQRDLSKIILVLFGGIFLFTTGNYRISREHTWILAEQHNFRSKCLVHPILAFLYTGLTNAARCDPFHGSPWLLQEWLIAHFPAIVKVSPDRMRSDLIKRTLAEWLSYFSKVQDNDISFVPYGVGEISVPLHNEVSFLQLIGIHHLVPYNPLRCSRLLDMRRLVILPYDWRTGLEERKTGGEGEVQLRDALERWNRNTGPRLIDGVRYPDDELERYCTGMNLKAFKFTAVDEADGEAARPQGRRRRRR